MKLGLSIIVPVFNVDSAILSNLLNSLHAAYKFHRDPELSVEIIVVDDGSNYSYDTKTLFNNFSAIPKINCVYVKKNLNCGVSSARNTGIKLSCHDYISFADADDIVAINYFEVFISLVRQFGKSYSFYTCSYMINYIKIYRKISKSKLPEEYVKSKYIHIGSVFVNKNLHKSLEFDSRLKRGEDIQFIIKLIGSGLGLHKNTCIYNYQYDYKSYGCNHSKFSRRIYYMIKYFLLMKFRKNSTLYSIVK